MSETNKVGRYGLALPLVAASSTFAGCIGIAVLIGWQFRIPFLKAPIPATAFMVPNAALYFILLALSLWLQRAKSSGARSSSLGRVCAAFVLVFACLTLLEYATGLDFGIDRVFFAHRLRDWSFKGTAGRAAWDTSLAFVSLALALLLLDRKWRRYPLCELLSLFAGLIAFLGLIGYWYGVPYLYDITSGQMAIYTVMTFLVLSTGVFFVRSDKGLSALLLSRDISGVVARRLLVMIIVVLPLLGWLEVKAQAAGIVSGQLGMVLLTCMSVVMFSALTLDTASRLRRENLEREFVESLRLLAAIVESTDDAIVTESLEGDVTTWNQGAERLYGYTAAEAIGQSLALTVPPQRQQELRDMLQCIRRGERVERHESVRICKDGRSIDVAVTLSPLKDSHGVITGASAIGRDITERKRAEAAQRASDKIALEWKQRMELAEQAALPIGFWEQDLISGKVTSSDEFYRQIGAPPDRPIIERLHPEDRHIVAAAVESVASGLSRAYDVQFRFIRPDGTICWIDSRGAMASDGSPRMIGIAIDITKLHRTEANYRSMVETAPYGIFRSTVDGRFLMVNPALVKMLGYMSESELLSLNLEDDVHRDPSERARLVSQFMETGSLHEVETEFKRKDGSVITVRISAVPVRKESGEIESLQGFIQDVTERKSLAQQFWKAQKMEAIGRLAGGVAHDFNNVLMIVGSYADLILQSQVKDGEVVRYAEQIQQSAAKAVSVTRQLLAFSRQQLLELEVLDLNTVVAELGKILPKLLGEDIAVVTTLEPMPHWAKVDHGQMEQIVMNLAVNARDAMPKGGRFEIKLQNVELDATYTAEHVPMNPGLYVKLSVVDTGIGMDSETQSQIFEPFFTTKERGKGTGLGLATVYGIVKQSGGFIWVTSEVGRGTTFDIYLPQLRAPVTAALKPPKLQAICRGLETILLVEDEASLRDAICEFLRSKGYTVLIAADGAEAMRTCEKHSGTIDVILTDLVMPGMDGIEVARAVSAWHPELQVLYMSGYTNRAAELLGAGAVLLRKPFRLSDLAVKLREVLEATGT